MIAISETLAIALEHHRAGRLRAAEQLYRQVLAIDPGQADAWHLLGVACAQLGSPRIAVDCIRRTIALRPDFPEAHNNLGRALQDLGNSGEAVACFQRALELKPDYAEAYRNLGVAWKDQGKLDEAVACCRRAVELKPDCADAHNQLGNVLKDQENPDEAVACCRRALELRPDCVEARSNLGILLAKQGKLDEAIACWRQALRLNPTYAEVHSNLGVALEKFGRLEEAIACYRRALELKPQCAEVHNFLGNALKKQGNPDEAVACYRRALELKPEFVEARGNLGAALEEAGDFRGAEDCFRTAMRHNGRFIFAHYKLAELLGSKLPAGDLARLRRLLEETGPSHADRLLLHFGLARVLDAQGEYAEAAEHLDRGNTLQRSEWRKCGQEYDPREFELLVTRMIAVSTTDFFERVRGFGLESELPVFVVGLPRSGTTLVEQILASHPQVFGAGEIKLTQDTVAVLGAEGADLPEALRRLDGPTVRDLASRHLEKLRALDRTALRIVDKMPENYLALGLLAGLFPRAKFIHCRRDLRDVAVSCWMTHFQEVRWSNDPEHIASRFQQYQRMIAHWRKVLPAPMLEVDYEQTVGDLEGMARKLVAWCNLPWEPACLEFHEAQRPVRTASAVQVRRPIFRTSVGRWKHYQQALAPLFVRLAGDRVMAGETPGSPDEPSRTPMI